MQKSWSLEITENHTRPVPSLSADDRKELAEAMNYDELSNHAKEMIEKLRYRAKYER